MANSTEPGTGFSDSERLALLGVRAATLVEDGMTIGLGSGSTAEAFVRALGERVSNGLQTRGVATSTRTEVLARSLGIPIMPLENGPTIDLGFDGADEIDRNLDVVKGRGGALLYEKLVALDCERWIVVAAAEKLVDQLGSRFGVPVEIVEFGWSQTLRRLERLGLEPALRAGPDKTPFRTDGGNLIVDCGTGLIENAEKLGLAIKSVSGVIDHGLFVGMAHAAMVSDLDGSVRTIEP